MFGPYLQPGGAELIQEDIRMTGVLKPDLWDNLVLEVKDVQAENVTGKGAEELFRLWNQTQPEKVLENPDTNGFRGDDSLLHRLLTYLPSELADQLRVNLPQIKARYARAVKDTPMPVEGESCSQTVDGESQDDSWLAAHFLPEAARQTILGLSSPASDSVDISRTITVSEETLEAVSTTLVSVPDGVPIVGSTTPPPHPFLDEALPISSPQVESTAPSRQPAVTANQRHAPNASLSKKRLRDPESPDIPLKRRKASLALEAESSSSAVASTSASLKSSSSVSKKQSRPFRKPAANTGSPTIYISPKLERKARHLGFKGEAEIQNLAAMREKLRAMTSKPVEEGDKLDHVSDKPDVGSWSSPSRNIRHSPRSVGDDPDRSLKEKVIQGIKDGRSAARLRCVGSQSQGP